MGTPARRLKIEERRNYCVVMSEEAKEVPVPAEEAKKEKPKPCCACPETKKIRDLCVVEKGEENCSDEIEAHKKCMREMGFNI